LYEPAENAQEKVQLKSSNSVVFAAAGKNFRPCFFFESAQVSGDFFSTSQQVP
jgi:hypothetical protein